ncbi:glycosyltransferase family 4 protein, partial [bacterium]|nr:glycosyltransferase family 4 protein [bacterium]
MRILWISRLTMGKTVGGVADPVQIEVPHHLCLRGHDVHIVVPTFSKETDFYARRSFPIHFLPTIPVFTTFSFWLILWFYLPIMSKKFDVVVVDWLSFFGALTMRRSSKAKIILDIRSPPVETTHLRGLISKIIFKPALFLAKYYSHGFTVITHMLKDEICRDFNVDKNLVGIWESGVDLSAFNQQSFNEERLTLRKKLNISERFVVMYHGVFSHTRGLQETIKAFNFLKTSHPNIVFILLGQGEA